MKSYFLFPPFLHRGTMLFLCLLYLNLAHATHAIALGKEDALKWYRDTTEQAEANAAQSIINHLPAAKEEPAEPSHQEGFIDAKRSQPTPFSPKSSLDGSYPDSTKNNQVRTPPSTQRPNPWLKPNPWAAKAKENPWANAPIPSPTPPPSKPLPNVNVPNIFAPSHPKNIPTPPSLTPSS